MSTKKVSEMTDEEIQALVGSDRAVIAEMIADWYGRSVIDPDYQLADAIIARLSKS